MISILLPIYNGERYIRKSLESILNQTYKNFELLIGFNGTIDNSINIVKEYNDDRIKIFEYNDKGKAKTLNKLLSEASFDFIALQDDDDIWISDKLSSQSNYFNTHDIIGSQFWYCDSNDNTRNAPFLQLENEQIKKSTLFGSNQIANSSAIIRKSALQDVGGWDENLEALEDYDLWVKLIMKDYKFINLNEKLLIHRIHNNSNFNTIDPNKQNKIMNDILVKNKLINS